MGGRFGVHPFLNFGDLELSEFSENSEISENSETPGATVKILI
jgi:hypothetical protein